MTDGSGATVGAGPAKPERGVAAEGWRFVAFVRLVRLFRFNLLNCALGFTRIALTRVQAGVALAVCEGRGGIMRTFAGCAGRMHSRIKMKWISLLLVLACSTVATLAVAQTAPVKPTAQPAAKPAAKPAVKPAAKPAPAAVGADGRTLSLGGGSGSSAVRGPLLAREELRACLKQEESIRTRLAQQDAGRAPLDQEKKAINADQQALRTEQAPIDEMKKKVEEFAVRLKDYDARVQSWNLRVEAHNALRAGSAAYDRSQVALNKEREEITKERTELEAERWRLTSQSETLVGAYNARAQALETLVTDWNVRNSAWNDTNGKLDTERKTWVSSCADRRYREDDETAIRQGK